MSLGQATATRLRRKVPTGALIAATIILLSAVLLGDAATLASPNTVEKAFRNAVGAAPLKKSDVNSSVPGVTNTGGTNSPKTVTTPGKDGTPAGAPSGGGSGGSGGGGGTCITVPGSSSCVTVTVPSVPCVTVPGSSTCVTLPTGATVPSIPCVTVPGSSSCITVPTLPGGVTTPTLPGGVTTPTLPGGVTTPTLPGGVTTPTVTIPVTTPTVTIPVTTPTLPKLPDPTVPLPTLPHLP